MSLPQLKVACAEARDTAGLQGSWQGVTLEAFGSRVAVSADVDGVLRGYIVVGGRLRTADGIGAGTTIVELQRLGPAEKVFLCGPQLAGISYLSRPGLMFLFSLCTLDGEASPLQLPQSASVVAVSVGGWAM